MTTNPDWSEITDHPQYGQIAYDVPVVGAHVFKHHLQCLLEILDTKLGAVVYLIYEFQKRGFPYAHFVLKVYSLSSTKHILLFTYIKL